MPAPPAAPAFGDAAPFRDALRFWARLGFVNFGGPAGQIALMHRELVEERGWIGEEQYLRALNFCMLLPGPEAQQLATYVGWRMHGTRGGIAAGSLFVLPSVFVLLLLSWLAAAWGNVPAVAALFYGISAVVLAIVAEAVLRIGRRALTHPALLVFSVAAFAALRFLHVPFPLVIGAAALGGAGFGRIAPRLFEQRKAAGAPRAEAVREGASDPSLLRWTRFVRLAAVFLVLWGIPVGAVFLLRPHDDVLPRLALFFTKAAFVTFGGAYAVLAYIADAAVNHFGWLEAGQMVHGLGLAETTPGPLIMVTQYVGFLAAWKEHAGFPPLLYATAGALLTTWVTFLPSFIFIFAGAPWIEALARARRLQDALSGITAAVVGVIANLAVFFAGKVLYPAPGRLDFFALVLAAGAFFVLWRWKVPVHWLVLAAALLGAAWKLAIATGS